MRNYMIAHFPKDNEWGIMRVSEEDVQYLNSNNEWTRERKWIKRFFHKDIAEGALVLAKIKGLKEEQQKEKEKQSWGEL